MFDKPLSVTVDIKRLRMRDLQALGKNAGDVVDWETMVPIMARVTGMTPDEVWDWDFETMLTVQKRLSEAMDDVVKKTTSAN